MTSAQENAAVVRRFISDLVNARNYDLARELLTAEYTRHDPNTPGDGRGREPFVEALRDLHSAFPDGEVHVGELVAADDFVAFEGTMTGTHEGVFMGIEPTDTPVEIHGTAMHRIRDGRIAETWATWNFLGLLRQLGATELPRE